MAKIDTCLNFPRNTEKALSAAGNVTMELQDIFRGDYFGSSTDKFGVQWMFNFPGKSK